MSDPNWVDLPGIYDAQVLDVLSNTLVDAGVDHETRVMPNGAEPQGHNDAHIVRVLSGHVGTAARVMGKLFEVEDPEAALPYDGPCPACEEPVENVWVCPSCELSFKPHVNPRDPMLLFLREHDGFVPPLADEKADEKAEPLE